MSKELTDLALVLGDLEVDEEARASLWKNGREAWKDVESAAEWVDELRGSQIDAPIKRTSPN